MKSSFDQNRKQKILWMAGRGGSPGVLRAEMGESKLQAQDGHPQLQTQTSDNTGPLEVCLGYCKGKIN